MFEIKGVIKKYSGKKVETDKIIIRETQTFKAFQLPVKLLCSVNNSDCRRFVAEYMQVNSDEIIIPQKIADLMYHGPLYVKPDETIISSKI